MKGTVLRGSLIALAFAALGGCLLLAGQGIRTSGGAAVKTAEIPDGRAALYCPAEAAEAVSAADEDGHTYAARPGGALILSDVLDGSDALATELARRDVTVLLAGRGTDPVLAWDWLLDSQGGGVSRAILISSSRRAGEAVALASERTGTDTACSGLILLSDREDVRAAAGYEGRNLLLLSDANLSPEEKTAFFGSATDAEQGFSGYFGDGSARALESGALLCSFAGRNAMLRVIDWQGSCLGHFRELADDDLIYRSILFCRAAAGCCFLLAAGQCVLTVRACVRRRREESQKERSV